MTAYPDYLDFDLELTPGVALGSYVARVLSSPRGEAEAAVTFPFDDHRLENVILKLGRTRSGVRKLGSPQQSLAKAFGVELYDSVFAGEVGTCFRRSLDEADRQGKGLRLRLRLSEAPGLSNVPWEYLFPEAVGYYLVLSARTPVVRYVDLPREVSPLSVEPPLRVLLVVSAPSDLAVLDTAREVENLRNAFGSLAERGLVSLDVLEKPTLSALRKALRGSTYHVLHFIGHGGYDDANTDGVLAFEDANSRSHKVSGGDLGTMLHDHRTLRLAVLNACEGARTSPMDPFSGVAQSLVRQGLPAVVAMQFEITDEAAIALAQEFYSALSDGYPVDAALAEGRKAVFGNDNDVEWGTPVLYLRAKDGRIFDVTPTGLIPPVRDPAPPGTAAVVPAAPHTDERVPDEPPVAEEPEPRGPVPPVPVLVPTVAVVMEPDRPPEGEGGASRNAGSGPVAPAAPGTVEQRGPTPSLPPELNPRGPTMSPYGGAAPHYVPARPIAASPKRGGGVAVLVVGLTVLALVCLLVAVGVWQYLSGVGSAASNGSGGEPLPLDGSVSMVATRGTPVIDGLTADWNDVGSFDCSIPVAGSENTGFRGVWALKWDDDNLYLLAGVFDSVLTQTHDVDVDQLWRGDSVSFELGPDARNRDLGRGARQSDDHFLFGPTVQGVVLNAVNHGPGFGSGTTDPSITARMTFAEGGQGYIVEIALPWSSTGLGSVQENTVVSINLNMSDADPNTGDLAMMVSTNADRSPENQQHPGLWQRLQLRSA